MRKKIHIGTCGFPLARRQYFQQFSCIEINITFYQLPGPKTAEGWRREAKEENPDFEFIIKAWQLITHPVNPVTYRRLREPLDPKFRGHYGFFRHTPQVMEAWVRTEEFCRRLGAHKILFQTPPTFRPTQENLSNMQDFFDRIKKSDLIFIFEPRGGSWAEEVVADICRSCRLVHAVDPLYARPSFGQFRYYRLHGQHRGIHLDYDYRYGDAELKRALEACDLEENYIMFNNSEMYHDAQRLQRMILDKKAGRW